jgi:hypothetical protein
LIVVFVTKYTPEIVHAVNGMGLGVVMLPVHQNFILQVYSTNTHSFQEIAQPLLDL